MNQKARRCSPRLEDVPELMHRIQSRLSLREAACTSVLSKSWLHAWSTIPNLRFHIQVERKRKMQLVDVERTLIRYFDDNIPFQRFELDIDIENQEAASLTEKWIRSVATKTCLKELSLTICPSGASLHLPAEILSGKNLTKITVSAARCPNSAVWMTTTRHPKCVSLRELHLSCVRISEELLHAIFSSCSLLKKIELILCSKGLKTIKVENLPCLSHLQIVTSDRGSTAFEINHVQNLRFFGCNVRIMNRLDKRRGPLINSHSISLGSSVTDLTLGGVMIRDNASLDMIIKLGLPFLKSLTLDMACWALGSFHFTSTSIKRFSMLGCPSTLVDVVHVTAPKLLFFSFTGQIIPSLLFPYSNLEQIEFRMGLYIDDLDAYFFLKMREVFMLSRKCKVIITTFNHNLPLPLEINIDDLRTRLLFPPAINVQQLLFKTIGDECMWERSPFFDAFFEICHPDHISVWPDSMLKHNNHFCKFMLREVMERNKNKTAATTSYWPSYLKNVQIKQPHNQKWETLTDSHTSFLEGPTPEHLPVEFMLTWC
ncbi:unnamed protein product [Lactuca virosa]|uniref:F-box/LRR-repeat protein 15/At3g58940/PEG3-like LRR domain-containing protein n=1 Tax=Lactuca virosa TaxID=75947 RepID=A0AAU9M6D8_9ASTR|nr:unnamed protein product [Lactuca virosa]